MARNLEVAGNLEMFRLSKKVGTLFSIFHQNNFLQLNLIFLSGEIGNMANARRVNLKKAMKMQFLGLCRLS
jgi:hypothetical protein